MNLSPPAPAFPEVWGGVESTFNRVGDRYFDQLARSGHAARAEDLELFAGLGIRALRYPVLWERVAPDGVASADWAWADERLDRLRGLGIRPIVGLVHHGSGPPTTSLVDMEFAEYLAEFAGAVARRYPWVSDYTPVNEPLTTARFSGLYGHWYPHGRDDLSFARALLNQCRATVLAMRAIRAVAPTARLVQTDDLGKTSSTPRLAYQADFENERRWLTFDLLCGRLAPDRPMWHWLLRAGIDELELDWFRQNPCPPDIVGINTYLSSERYLDERLEHFPGEVPGTNGRDTYVDVLAARVLPEGIAGPAGLLREAWDRYRLPLAITEAHNGSTREEQLRWLDDVWRGALKARGDGIDVRAVTVWALLGSHDWPSLVTADDGIYEPGVFDIRSPQPRPTAIARMMRDLATHGRHDHPVLAVPGWWRRPDRFIYPLGSALERDEREAWWSKGRPRLLIVGTPSPLTAALTDACVSRRIPCHTIETDSADTLHLRRALDQSDVWAVVDVGDALPVAGGAPFLFWAHTPEAPELAGICAARSLSFVAFSSDRVFDGRQQTPSTESTPVSSTDDVGMRQADAERRVMSRHPSALVVRTGPLFGVVGTADVDADVQGHARPTVDHHSPINGREAVSPTYLPDATHAILDLLLDGATGVWHVANRGFTTMLAFQLAMETGILAGQPDAPVVHQAEDSRPECRSRVLESERAWLLPDLDDALERYAARYRSDTAMRSTAGWQAPLAPPNTGASHP